MWPIAPRSFSMLLFRSRSDRPRWQVKPAAKVRKEHNVQELDSNYFAIASFVFCCGQSLRLLYLKKRCVDCGTEAIAERLATVLANGPVFEIVGVAVDMVVNRVSFHRLSTRFDYQVLYLLHV